MKWGSISSHEPVDDGGEGRLEWEDWERSEGRDSRESILTPVSEKYAEERGTLASRRWRRERSPRLASNSNIEGEFERCVSGKDGQAGDHATGEVLHGTPMFINKVIKLRLKNIILDR